MERSFGERVGTTRRGLLSAVGAGAVAVAGCSAPIGGSRETGPLDLAAFRGSGPVVAGRPEPGGPSMDDLPDLEGELTIYLGGGEGGLYVDLVSLIERKYPDFRARTTTAPSSQLANSLLEELSGAGSPADVFWAVDAGSLGVVAEAGGTVRLPDSVLDAVPDPFHAPDGAWVGVAGRARAIPYNTDRFDAADLPDDVFAFASAPRFADAMGWAPTYGAFQAFVTAMRILEGEERTREWLRGMLDQDVAAYSDEFFVSNFVADGEIGAGFANHYYALRVKNARPNAPIDLAFTRNDAGAIVNVSGAEIIGGTDRRELAGTFVRHLLSAEAQEFFATRTFAYPMIPGVAPVGGLPRIDELDPPALDLTELSDLKPTLSLMREVGVL